MNQHRTSLTFPVFGGIPQADAYPRYTRLHLTSFVEKLPWEFPQENIPHGRQPVLPGSGADGDAVRMDPKHCLSAVSWQTAFRAPLSWWGYGGCKWNWCRADLWDKLSWKLGVKTGSLHGKTKSQTLDVFPPSDCCFTHYEFYENCVEWNGDLLGRLKAMLMEQATPEWLLCPRSFQSKFSQSHSNAAADDCSSWQSPFLNSSLRKWAKTSPHQIQFGLRWKAPGCTLVWAVLNFQFQFQCSWTS